MVTVNFIPDLFQLTVKAGPHGSANSSVSMIRGSATFILTPDLGYVIDRAVGIGCEGSLDGFVYTTNTLTADCIVSVGFRRGTLLALEVGAIKSFNFSWVDSLGATHYKLLENSDGQSGFSQVGVDIDAGVEKFEHIVALYSRLNARYLLQICNVEVCTDSNTVDIYGNLVDGIGYIKASNTDADDWFGRVIKLSADGSTLAVATSRENSSATGINGDQSDNSLTNAGAVYVYTRTGSQWVHQAYIKASNTDAGDGFGVSIDLSADGSTLAVGAGGEDSKATTINGDQSDNSGDSVGAAYIFTRTGENWSQQSYIKANLTRPTGSGFGTGFGGSVALDAEGNTLAVGCSWCGDNDKATGLAYVFTRQGVTWVEQQVLNASNADSSNAGYTDGFGIELELSDDGNTLAAGAPYEDSAAQGVDGDQSDNIARDSGAVYMFNRINNLWSQQAYIKASNPDVNDFFGSKMSLSGDGKFLAVGVEKENSSNEIDQFSSSLLVSGATYVFQFGDAGWSQIDFLKASNAEQSDMFGFSTSFNFDGSLLAIGAPGEDGGSHGLDGDSLSYHAPSSGAVYTFRYIENKFQQTNYIKAKYTRENSGFGVAVSLSGDGETLAVADPSDNSFATGVGGDHFNTNSQDSGAVLLY